MESTFIKVDAVEFRFDGVFSETAGVDQSILDQSFFCFLFDVVRKFDFRLEVCDRGDIGKVGVTSKLGGKESFHSKDISRALLGEDTLLQLQHR